jgi:hypothetical protein
MAFLIISDSFKMIFNTIFWNALSGIFRIFIPKPLLHHFFFTRNTPEENDNIGNDPGQPDEPVGG